MKPAVDVLSPALPSGSLATRTGGQAGYWLVVSTHALIDVFPMFILSLMIVLSDRLHLTAAQETIVWIALPVFSGGCQPLFAWLSDRFDTRLAGPFGLATGAICLSGIGFAETFWQFLVLEIVGVIGVGMYHPTAVAVAGQVGSRAMRGGRTMAISLFVTAGMLGHTLGPVLATNINAWVGMKHLAWMIIPSLVLAFLLLRVTRSVSHRPEDHHDHHRAFEAHELRERWWTVLLLCGQNSIRFAVNTAIYIVFNYWAASRIADSNEAALLTGRLLAATTIGMGVGALGAGWIIRPGREKAPFVLTAFGSAACVAAMCAASRLGVWPMYAAAFLAAAGFFATVPPSVGLGQRLLPGHASLVSSLLLGVGWLLGALARPVTARLLGVNELADASTIPTRAFDTAFIGLAVLLVFAGILALFMPRDAVAAAADRS